MYMPDTKRCCRTLHDASCGPSKDSCICRTLHDVVEHSMMHHVNRRTTHVYVRHSAMPHVNRRTIMYMSYTTRCCQTLHDASTMPPRCLHDASCEPSNDSCICRTLLDIVEHSTMPPVNRQIMYTPTRSHWAASLIRQGDLYPWKRSAIRKGDRGLIGRPP